MQVLLFFRKKILYYNGENTGMPGTHKHVSA